MDPNSGKFYAESDVAAVSDSLKKLVSEAQDLFPDKPYSKQPAAKLHYIEKDGEVIRVPKDFVHFTVGELIPIKGHFFKLLEVDLAEHTIKLKWRGPTKSTKRKQGHGTRRRK